MPPNRWLCVTMFLCVILLGLGTGRAVLPAYVLRFSETLPTQDTSSQAAFTGPSVTARTRGVSQ